MDTVKKNTFCQNLVSLFRGFSKSGCFDNLFFIAIFRFCVKFDVMEKQPQRLLKTIIMKQQSQHTCSNTAAGETETYIGFMLLSCACVNVLFSLFWLKIINSEIKKINPVFHLVFQAVLQLYSPGPKCEPQDLNYRYFCTR